MQKTRPLSLSIEKYLNVYFNKMPLNHFMCPGFTYCLQKNKEVNLRPDILIGIFSAMSEKKNLRETK